MFENLTEEQKKILSQEGDLIVIAGPGTGKTYTLINKIKYLLENNPPEKILVLTFSLKTSQELKARLKKENLSFIKIDTFHGLAYDLWRDYFNKEPPLISEKEKTMILKKLFPKIKNPLRNEKYKEMYFKYLRSKNLLDFELLLYEVSKINLPDFENYYIIIDEFQDLSPDILEFLKPFQKANFLLFGDPNQSIYGFRGVNLEKIYTFWHNFKPHMKVFNLTLSFRCPERILKYAENFKTAPWKVPPYKSLKENGTVQGFLFPNTFEEEDYLVNLVKNLLGGLQLENQKYGSVSPKDIFILSRIKNVFSSLKNRFLKEGIPINVVEEDAFNCYEKITEFLNLLEKSAFPIDKLIENCDPEIRNFLENLWALASEDKEKFISYLKILEPSDFINPYKEGVNFLSIHASKGLEAEYVILVGAEDGLIPLKLFEDTSEDEEKRLIYVSLTRAKNGFFFTSVRERKVFNFTLNKGVSSYFKNFPLKTFSPKPKKPKQSGLFNL
jgi:superfamily I DNA/RNA helicase